MAQEIKSRPHLYEALSSVPDAAYPPYFHKQLHVSPIIKRERSTSLGKYHGGGGMRKGLAWEAGAPWAARLMVALFGSHKHWAQEGESVCNTHERRREEQWTLCYRNTGASEGEERGALVWKLESEGSGRPPREKGRECMAQEASQETVSADATTYACQFWISELNTIQPRASRTPSCTFPHWLTPATHRAEAPSASKACEDLCLGWCLWDRHAIRHQQWCKRLFKLRVMTLLSYHKCFRVLIHFIYERWKEY